MNRCRTCSDPRRLELEKALLAGVPYRKLSRAYGVPQSSLYRHRQRHLHLLMLRSKELGDITNADSLLNRLRSLHAETLEILADARRKNNGELALKAIARAEAQVELSARLLGEIRDRQVNVVNVTLDPATAERMAETFLRRRKLELEAPGLPAVEVEAAVIEEGAKNEP
jgi:hypothetical protein